MLNLGIDISPLTTSTRTGVGEYTYGLLNALFNIDRNNQYFLFYNAFVDVEKYVPDWKRENIHFVQTRWPNKLFHSSIQFLGWPKIDRLIEKKKKIKLDYFFSPNIGFQKISKETKHLLTVHDLSFEIFPDCFSRKMQLWHNFLSPKKQCQLAGQIFVPSKNTKRDIHEMYEIPEEKITVVYPGISKVYTNEITDTQKQEVRTKYNLPVKYILFLGTIEPRKNIEAVLQGFEQFQKKHGNDYHLVIAGAGGWKNRKIMKAIEKNKSAAYIGYVEPLDKPALYAMASVFVYPSLYEGFGFPVLEAMACGIPVITSSRSSLPEIADNAAYYVNPSYPSEIAEGLDRILGPTELHNFFVQKGKMQAGKFSWDKTAEQFLNFLV